MISPSVLSKLLNALSDTHTCVLLGAGASTPQLPVTGQIRDALRPIAVAVGSYPAHSLPQSPARTLISTQAADPMSLEDWKLNQLTDAAINLGIAFTFGREKRCPPQYTVFRNFAERMIVFSFNWDGLAERCMPQLVISPHGQARWHYGTEEFEEALFDSQMFEEAGSLLFRTPGLVYPGEEEAATRPLRRIMELVLRKSTHLVIIGYNLALSPDSEYDLVWRDLVIGVASEFDIPTFVVSPGAREVAENFQELAKNRLVLPVEVSWYVLAQALWRVVRRGISTQHLASDATELLEEYLRVLDGT